MSEVRPYCPFLKLKQNEVIGVSLLNDSVRNAVTPLFDFPKGNDGSADMLKDYVLARARQFEKYLGKDFLFYLDTFDVDDQTIDGVHSYEFILDQFSFGKVIPVTGIDRSDKHQEAIKNSLSKGSIGSSKIGLRFQLDDMHSYDAVKSDIDDYLGESLSLFEEIDLICDLRVCLNHDTSSASKIVESFITGFVNDYNVDKVIVSGSSIPSNISDICPPQKIVDVERKELGIYLALEKSLNLKETLTLGDYTVVSPEYSEPDLDPQLIRSVMTSKLIYSHGKVHRIWRGTTMKMEGEKQYNEHALDLVQSSIFRGSTFSWADNEYQIKSLLTSGFSASSIIKHGVCAHIEFMCKVGV